MARQQSPLLGQVIRQNRTITFYDCSMKNINHAKNEGSDHGY